MLDQPVVGRVDEIERVDHETVGAALGRMGSESGGDPGAVADASQEGNATGSGFDAHPDRFAVLVHFKRHVFGNSATDHDDVGARGREPVDVLGEGVEVDQVVGGEGGGREGDDASYLGFEFCGVVRLTAPVVDCCGRDASFLSMTGKRGLSPGRLLRQEMLRSSA